MCAGLRAPHACSVKHNEFPPIRPVVPRATLLLTLFGLPFAVFALDLATLDDWRSLLPTHAGWTLLAGFGLVAVAVAVLTIRRLRSEPIADDEPLGRMREDLPSTLSLRRL